MKLIDQINQQRKEKVLQTKRALLAESEKEAKRNAENYEFFVNTTLSLLPEAILKAAEKDNSYILTIERRDPAYVDKYLKAVIEFANQNGLGVSARDRFQTAERGDPESGEGQRDAAWMTDYIFTWTQS